MNLTLLQTITSSEKRKEILFILRSGNKTLSQIKEHFDVTTPEIQPRLKEMEAANLILKQDGLYSIAPFGEVLASYYKPLLDTIEAIESNQKFWMDHDISGIPDFLIHRIKELKYCKVDTADDCSIFESHTDFVDNVFNAKSFKGAACVFLPSWVDLFVEISSTGASVELILTQSVYQKLKNDNTQKYEIMIKNGIQIYICDKVNTSFAVTDPLYFSFALYLKNGTYDHKHDLMGYDSKSAKWGTDLFEYYREMSTLVTDPNFERTFVGNEKEKIIVSAAYAGDSNDCM